MNSHHQKQNIVILGSSQQRTCCVWSKSRQA